ncbi:hypothetical protein FIBSPDRAFT_873795, partial [Athelia psychrophila]
MLDDDDTRGPGRDSCYNFWVSNGRLPLPHEQPTLTLPRRRATWITERNPHQLLRRGAGALDGSAPTQSILHLSQTHYHCPPRRRLPTPYELQS